MVANYSTPDDVKKICVSKEFAHDYLVVGQNHEVFFPDHMCGPDIIYKCHTTQTVYIVQVKFVKDMDKQKAVEAFATTDPELFYCNRTTNEPFDASVFVERREKLNNQLLSLQRDDWSIQQMLVAHSNVNMSSLTLITGKTHPNFFDKLGNGIWKCLDDIQKSFWLRG